MTYRVVFAREAEAQMIDLYRFIAEAAAPSIAAAYTEAIIRSCETLAHFPQRGIARDDIRPGLRMTHFKNKTMIAYSIMDETVAVIGIFYGGQDYGALLGGT